MLQEIGERLEISTTLDTMEQSAYALDAGVCILAAHDLLVGQASKPPDAELASREGWIWVRRPNS
jgi:hypothetical protein